MLDGLQDTISNIGEGIKSFVTEKPIVSAALGSAAVGATALGVVKAVKSRRKSKAKTKKKTKSRRKTSKKRKKSGRKLKFGSPAWRKKYLKKKKSKKRISPKYARTAGKRRDTSTKRIRMTKHGQPYIILANGRARFIKKSSAKRSRKLKGGRY